MTIRELVYKTMRDDVTLRALLSKTVTPYGIYLVNPPKVPKFPIITYFVNAQTGRFPRSIPFDITAWGNNYVAIQDRIYTLFNNQVTSVTDYHNLMMKWDWASPELYDMNYKIYFQQSRYLVKGIKS